MGVFFGWLSLSIIVACIASSKGRTGFGWFCLSMLVSPIISIIILLCVGDSQEKKEKDLNTAMDIIERRKSDNCNWLPEKESDEIEQDSMSQEQAIKELKKAKDLLDLQVISQEDYDAKKAELLPFLCGDYPSQESAVDIVEEPLTIVEDIPQETDESEIETNDKPIEYRWYQNTLIQILIAAFVSLVIVCLIGFFIRSSSSTNKQKKQPANTAYVAKPLPHSHSKKHKNRSIDEILKSEDSENKSFSKSDKKVVEQFISLYKELLKFKNEYEFVQIGFDPDGKYYNWLEKVHKFETKTNTDVLIKLSVIPNDLETLGMEYVITHGQESEITQFFRGEIDEAIQQYKESQR
ncbi:MAG: SHOCT domain-containing protein [Paludibacteraceae bacterium]|nr:SHOCT domain-containing protein [Paludibacteraceae bacterium]